MAKLHKHFVEFHEATKLGDLDENAGLREKRNLLIQNLRDNLPDEAPKILRTFNQGSYAMGTGIRPRDGDYDIDVAVVFDCGLESQSPISIKKTVRDALSHPNRTVDIRRSCVTVSYLKGEDIQYHVDLAVYVEDSSGNLYLAKGKEQSSPDLCFWEESDPQGLCNAIVNRHEGDDRAQYRRVIRYLKCWRDHCISHGGLPSIALTVAAYHWFRPYKDWINEKANDPKALVELIDKMLVSWELSLRNFGFRLKVKLPVMPWANLLEKMTDKQMEDLESSLRDLRGALKDALNDPDEVAACHSLSKFFGNDFPTPEHDEAKAHQVDASVVNTGSSA